MNCVLYHSLNLLLLAVATAIGAPESRANEIQAIIRGADQAFTRTFAEGFIRTWPRQMAAARKSIQRDLPRDADREPSRSGQDDGVPLVRRPEQPRAGSAFAATLNESVAAVPRKPSFQMRPAEPLAKRSPDVSPAEPTPPSAERPRVAMAKAQAKQSDATIAAPAQQPEKPAPEKTPNQRVAKADPVAPPLPEASATSPAGFKFKDCDFCPPLVVVPNGEFQMGSSEHPHEKPAHKVRIAFPFAIGQYEVTYAQWDSCVEAGACRYRPERQGSPGEAIGNLSWDDANAYLKWMSEKTGQIYRLPSEAEWEYAARAGPVKGAKNNQPMAAEASNANAFGLYDTEGNRAEWVEDCWNESYQGAPADGSAWVKGNCSLRGLRGGAFGSNSRFRYDSDVRYEANGFRVLRELH